MMLWKVSLDVCAGCVAAVCAAPTRISPPHIAASGNLAVEMYDVIMRAVRSLRRLLILQRHPRSGAAGTGRMLVRPMRGRLLRGSLPSPSTRPMRVQDLPSFLQEVTTVRGQIAYAGPTLRAARGAPPSLAAIDDIELSQHELLVPLAEMAAAAAAAAAPAPAEAAGKAGRPGGGALVPLSERYPLPPLAMLKLVLARQAKLFVRDVTLVRARIMQCIVMGLLIGGLWFQRDNTLDDARCALQPYSAMHAEPERCRYCSSECDTGVCACATSLTAPRPRACMVTAALYMRCRVCMHSLAACFNKVQLSCNSCNTCMHDAHKTPILLSHPQCRCAFITARRPHSLILHWESAAIEGIQSKT